MTISTIRNLENSFTEASLEQQKNSPYCTLTWRRGKLLVRPVGQQKQPYLPATNNKESLVECLEHSPVNLVLIDPELGFSKVKLWADATSAAGKSIYLSIPSLETSKRNPWEWCQVILNWIVAFILLMVLSPVALGLTILMRVYSPGSLFTREWYVGKRGKLFQVVKFRTTAINKNVVDDFCYQNNLLNTLDTNYTLIGNLMRKYGLDNIPLLLNILRGEINLFGRQSIKLEDAVKFNPEKLRQLNKAPGIAGLWQTASESKLLHLDSQPL
ncbi:MAG: sugar transferase [Calothrix sp. FI2-JRJ7]|nr:sugar transferase [Calothrix sp. FI2-JRJ7]